MAGKTPIEVLKSFRPLTHEAIGAMPVVVLDQFNMHIDDLFDLKEIPWDNSPRNIKKLNETMAHYNKFFCTAKFAAKLSNTLF